MVPVARISSYQSPESARKDYIRCVKNCADDARCKTIEEELPHGKTVKYASCEIYDKHDQLSCQSCLRVYKAKLELALEAIELELKFTDSWAVNDDTQFEFAVKFTDSHDHSSFSDEEWYVDEGEIYP